MPAAVAVNGPTPVVQSSPSLEVNGAATTTTKKPKLTKNQMKRERKKQKKAAEKQGSKEASVVAEKEEAEGESVSLPCWSILRAGAVCVCGGGMCVEGVCVRVG